MDLLADGADVISFTNDSSRVILDHVSTARGMDETISVTKATDVTVHCYLAASPHPIFQ